MELEPIDPDTAVELYLAERESDATASTIRSHGSRLSFFVEWCDERGIDNLNELTGQRLHEYRLRRRDDGDLSKATEKTHMDTLRVFIRWLGTVDGVDPDLHLKVRSPDLDPDENTRDVMLESDDAEAILGYLAKYEWQLGPSVPKVLLGLEEVVSAASITSDMGGSSFGRRRRSPSPARSVTVGRHSVGSWSASSVPYMPMYATST